MPRKKTTTAKKTKKVEDMSQAHGKVEKPLYTTLEQIWGDTGISEYKTLDESVYSQQLDAMNKSDLQNHASKRGLIPVDDRGLLTKRLINEFRKHVNQYQMPQDSVENGYENLSPEARKTLEEGR